MKLVSRMYDDLHGYQIIYHHMPTFIHPLSNHTEGVEVEEQ